LLSGQAIPDRHSPSQLFNGRNILINRGNRLIRQSETRNHTAKRLGLSTETACRHGNVLNQCRILLGNAVKFSNGNGDLGNTLALLIRCQRNLSNQFIDPIDAAQHGCHGGSRTLGCPTAILNARHGIGNQFFNLF